jgi:WD40 repeat protein
MCAISDGNRLASGSRDSALRVWNLSTGECERVLDTLTEVIEIFSLLLLDFALNVCI